MNTFLGSKTMKLIATTLLLLSAVTASFASFAAIPMAQLTDEQRRQTEVMLTQLLQRFIDQQERLDGQGKLIRVQVRLDQTKGFDQAKGFIIIDLSPNYLTAGRQDIEDHTNDLAILARSKIKSSIIVHGIEFTYGGRDIYDYYPDERPEPYQYKRLPPRPKQSQRKGASLTGTADDFVVVSAGHGKYIHFPFGRDPAWRWQRPDVSSGVLEDTNNSDFADVLRYWISERADSVITAAPRSTSTAIHEPSGEAWRNVAGRYYLQSILPDNPDVWEHGGNTRPPLRHYDQDANSRPRFANYLNATAIISLHSNATGTLDPSIRGTEVIYHTGRGQDRLLGNSILCSMKEIIQAQDAYATFPVDAESTARNNLAENSLVQNRLAVIVEVAYRTNPSDAAALQDPFSRGSNEGSGKGISALQGRHTMRAV